MHYPILIITVNELEIHCIIKSDIERQKLRIKGLLITENWGMRRKNSTQRLQC